MIRDDRFAELESVFDSRVRRRARTDFLRFFEDGTNES